MSTAHGVQVEQTLGAAAPTVGNPPLSIGTWFERAILTALLLQPELTYISWPSLCSEASLG